MIKRTPSFGQLTAMVVFALSCFSLVLFLWVSFGGPVPLKPQGYRVHVSFNEAVQLATEGDVRISGVSVGKVKKVSPSTGRTDAVLEIDSRYAPLPDDVKAMLRIKTLLGETYIQLTPGTKGRPTIPENGYLPVAQVSPTVELEEVISTFDAPTRAAFGDWLVGQSDAVQGRGDELNQAFGVLPMFFSDTNDLMTVLRRQDRALSRVFANTADIFTAFDSRPGQLTDLILASNKLLRVTSNRGQQLTQTFNEFPGFLRETRAAVKRFTVFTQNSQPLLDNLSKFGTESSPTIRKANKVTADARALITNLEPMLDKADAGVPAASEFFQLARPTVAQLDPFLRQLNPILEFVGAYRQELAGFLANDAAASQAQFTDATKKRQSGHYLRAMATLTPESLAYLNRRTDGSRANAYPVPGAISPDRLAAGLQVFDAAQCSGIAVPTLDPNQADYVAAGYDAGDSANFSQILDRINNIVYGNTTPYPAPACNEQTPMTFGGETTKYPHVRKRATP
jgi:phospholipid/cholesterol/gamma-HCH transport system substrate-binding protein